MKTVAEYNIAGHRYQVKWSTKSQLCRFAVWKNGHRDALTTSTVEAAKHKILTDAQEVVGADIATLVAQLAEAHNLFRELQKVDDLKAFQKGGIRPKSTPNDPGRK